MSDIANAIDKVIGHGLAPRLKRSAFRKHQRTFVRDQGAVQQIVSVQASQWNEGPVGQFTLNLGLYFPSVAQCRGLLASGQYPKEYESTIRERIGSLIPTTGDYWWKIDTSTDLVALGEEVGRTYDAYGAPWFDSIGGDLRAVLDQLIRKNDALMAAAVALELNEAETATSILSRAATNSRVPAFVHTVRLFAERRGLKLPDVP